MPSPRQIRLKINGQPSTCGPSFVVFLIYSDIDKIHDGIGDKLAILVQWVVTFFAGFVIGFVRDWRLSLFLLFAVTPPLAIVAGIFSKVINITRL